MYMILGRISIWLTLILCASCEIYDISAPGNLVPKTVAEDLSLPAITVNGTRLHAEAFGDPGNPAIVFLHAGPGSNYRSLLSLTPLQDDFYLVYFDQRGAGLSERLGKSQLTLESYIEDLYQVINHYTKSDTSTITLVGYSWGGQYATAFIAQHPERVKNAILIDPGPFNSEIFAEMNFANFDFSDEWINEFIWNNDFISPDDHARLDYSWAIADNDSSFDERYGLSSGDFKREERNGRFGALLAITFQFGSQGFDFTKGLENFTEPILFIRSERNRIHHEAYIRKQMNFYKDPTLITIPDVGHDLITVKPQETMNTIRNFLQ